MGYRLRCCCHPIAEEGTAAAATNGDMTRPLSGGSRLTTRRLSISTNAFRKAPRASRSLSSSNACAGSTSTRKLLYEEGAFAAAASPASPCGSASVPRCIKPLYGTYCRSWRHCEAVRKGLAAMPRGSSPFPSIAARPPRTKALGLAWPKSGFSWSMSKALVTRKGFIHIAAPPPAWGEAPCR